MSFSHTSTDGVSLDWSGTPIYEGDMVALVDETGLTVNDRLGTVLDGDPEHGVWVVWDDDLVKEQLPGYRLVVTY